MNSCGNGQADIKWPQGLGSGSVSVHGFMASIIWHWRGSPSQVHLDKVGSDIFELPWLRASSVQDLSRVHALARGQRDGCQHDAGPM